MFGIGWTELTVIFILALVVFGPKRLPEIGKALAKSLHLFQEASREMKEGLRDIQAEIESEIRETEKAKRQITQELLEDHSEKEASELTPEDEIPIDSPEIPDENENRIEDTDSHSSYIG